MHARRLLGIACVTAGAVAAGWATSNVSACPFCSAPSLTLTEQMDQANAALLVKWAGGQPAKDQDGGFTEYEVVEVVKQPTGGKLEKGNKVKLVRYRAAKAGDLYMLLGTTAGAVIDWGSPIEVTEDSFAYVKNSPKPDLPTKARLLYFLKFLEHPNPMVSTDAYGEFANAPYADITAISAEFPREELKTWLNDPQTSPSRLGLYGLMLGLCGKDNDALVLEKKIFEPTTEFRLGIDGIMGGYLLLTGEKGLALIEEKKLADKKVPFSETYSAMQALRFLWQYGDGEFKPERLRQSMRILLDRPELADLVIADLARWKDWSVQDRLMAMYGKDEYDIPSIKRAVVRYMLACSKDMMAAEKDVTNATLHLADLEARDPKTVSDAKRFFFIK